MQENNWALGGHGFSEEKAEVLCQKGRRHLLWVDSKAAKNMCKIQF